MSGAKLLHSLTTAPVFRMRPEKTLGHSIRSSACSSKSTRDTFLRLLRKKRLSSRRLAPDLQLFAVAVITGFSGWQAIPNYDCLKS
jgi:hypothetical protein